MAPFLRHRSIRTQLLVLLGVAVIPLVALWAHTVQEEYRARTVAAEQAVLTLAETNAIHMERFVQDVEAILDELAARHSRGLLTEEDCHDRLGAFRDLSPAVAELSEFGADGELLCTSSALLGPDLATEVPEREEFMGPLRERGGVVYSDPLRGWISGELVTVVVKAVEDDQGEMVGTVGAAVHLSRLQEVLTPATLPEGTLVTVTRADDGTVVARSEDWESWVGETIQWGDVTEQQMLAGPGLNRTHGADGVDRLWGFAPISGPEWVVFVGVPKEGVYDPIRTATIRRGGLALVVLILVGLLGGFLYRSIGRAVTGVTADARAAADRAGVRLHPRGPLELDQLVHEFNRTLDSRERTDDELMRAERRLHESRRLEAVGHLAAGVAHDFNNALTVIQGEAALMEDDFPEGDPRRDAIARIQAASDRAARMVARLLAVGRKDRVRPRRLNPARSVAEMEESLRREFGDRIDLDFSTDLTIPSVYMDPGHLEEVIRNLVRNACDAMPNGGRVSVSLGEETTGRGIDQDGEGGEAEDTVSEEETFVVIRVEDPGTGMAPEVLERAFDPFFTTKGHGEGSGLGLATVHGIVTRAGGDVMVNSEPGRGTRVTVRLPAADGVPEARRDAEEGG